VATLLFGLQNFYLPAIGHLINTPMTFTGRTEIWNAVWRYIAAHPVLGAGYGSFWNIGPASPIFTYGFGWVQEVSEGHNGYLDLLAAIGPFGFLLVIAGAYVVPIVRLIGWRQSQRDTGALLMAMMIFIIGHNFTESSLFDRDTIGQVFLMLTIAGIWSVNPRSRSAESGERPVWLGQPRRESQLCAGCPGAGVSASHAHLPDRRVARPARWPRSLLRAGRGGGGTGR
jgi:O-antigen ligase